MLNKAQNIVLRNRRVVWGANPPSYFRQALESHAVASLRLENFQGNAANPEHYPAIMIED